MNRQNRQASRAVMAAGMVAALAFTAVAASLPASAAVPPSLTAGNVHGADLWAQDVPYEIRNVNTATAAFYAQAWSGDAWVTWLARQPGQWTESGTITPDLIIPWAAGDASFAPGEHWLRVAVCLGWSPDEAVSPETCNHELAASQPAKATIAATPVAASSAVSVKPRPKAGKRFVKVRTNVPFALPVSVKVGNRTPVAAEAGQVWTKIAVPVTLKKGKRITVSWHVSGLRGAPLDESVQVRVP